MDDEVKIEDDFNYEILKSYPHGEQKISVEIGKYSLTFNSDPTQRQKAQTTYISPHGMEIQGVKDYPQGTLLKISVNLPDYWTRKKRFVEYNRIDTPEDFKVLAKVIGSQPIGKRGKKRLILVQTVNIDEVDEKVLAAYLEEKKK